MLKKSRIQIISVALFLAALSGCSGGGGTPIVGPPGTPTPAPTSTPTPTATPTPTPSPTPAPAVQVVPTQAIWTLSSQHSLRSTGGTAAGGLSWVVLESACGSMQTASGTFDPVSNLTFNVYIAPSIAPSTPCHVKVSSVGDPAKSAVAAVIAAASAGQFAVPATSANSHGQDFTVTDLENGTVLILGGDNAAGVNELYNLGSKAFTSVPPMLTPRYQHTAALLHKGINAGRALVCGGLDASNNVLSSCELYDVPSNTFLPGPNMAAGRRNAAASELPTSGDVLISGGNGAPNQVADLYTASTGGFAAGCVMTSVRFAHSSSVLPGEKLLLAGGGASAALATAEIYDHATNTCTATQNNMSIARLGHAAVPLPNGKILIGGTSDQFTTSPILDLFDPATSSFTRTSDLQLNRCCFQMNLLSTGKVLISGGLTTAGEAQIFSELFDPTTGTTAATDYMHQHRFLHKGVSVSSGTSVLAIGGHGNAGESTQPVDTYTP